MNEDYGSFDRPSSYRKALKDIAFHRIVINHNLEKKLATVSYVNITENTTKDPIDIRFKSKNKETL